MTVTYNYDPASGRLSNITYPQGMQSRTYFPLTTLPSGIIGGGQLQTVTTPGGETLTYTHDGFLRTGVAWSGGGDAGVGVTGSVTFGFDSNFRLTTQSVNGANALMLGYDADGLLTQACFGANCLQGTPLITHDPNNGRITGTTLGSVTDAYTYDPATGLLASYVATYGTTTLYSETISLRDNVGRITQKTETNNGVTHVFGYSYYPAGELETVTKDGATISSYAYDQDDNRKSVTNASGTIIPAYDAQDRLQTYGAATYSYTANGELQSKTVGSQTTTYTYDVLGNLLQVAPPTGSAIAYVVDGENRRVGREVGGTLTTSFLYQDGLRVVAQLDGSGNVVARYVFGSKPNVPDYFTNSTGTFRILSDHLGSPRLVVNASTGAVVERSTTTSLAT